MTTVGAHRKSVVKDILVRHTRGKRFTSHQEGDRSDFGYYVDDISQDLSFGQIESRLSDGTTNGIYEVYQPDGLNRVVNYSAGKDSGFVANVSYFDGSGYLIKQM